MDIFMSRRGDADPYNIQIPTPHHHRTERNEDGKILWSTKHPQKSVQSPLYVVTLLEQCPSQIKHNNQAGGRQIGKALLHFQLVGLMLCGCIYTLSQGYPSFATYNILFDAY
jgi:hypothetical protein